jgi:cupin 2 domain-containing protein
MKHYYSSERGRKASFLLMPFINPLQIYKKYFTLPSNSPISMPFGFDMMNRGKNIFADVPENLCDELIETILHAANIRVERIVSRGHRSPEGYWYDQDDAEWVILLKGRAELRFQGREEPVMLNPGEYIAIDRHKKHRVEWTVPDEETIWLAVHYR